MWSCIRFFATSVAMFLIAAITAPAIGAQTDPQSSTLIAHAVGSTGTELLELQVDGVTIATQQLSATGNVYSSRATTTPVEFDIPAGLDHGQIRIAFNNDGLVGGVSRDLRVDRIELEGVTYETNDMVIESAGSFSNGACRRGFLESVVLACNGWFQLPAGEQVTGAVGAVVTPETTVTPALEIVPPQTAPSADQRVEIRALGTTGEEIIELRIAGKVEATFGLTTSSQTYLYEGPISTNEVQVAFINDSVRPGSDRNVRVDYIRVDGETLQTEDPSVLSQGAYSANNGCGPGNKQTEVLHCNGFFEYSLQDSTTQPVSDQASPTEAPVTGPVITETPVTPPSVESASLSGPALTGAQVNRLLGAGMNFGDTLDAPREGDWSGGLEASHFRIVADAGFDHVRLPVSWAGYASNSAPYTIPDGNDPTISHPDYNNIWERIDWAIDQAELNDLRIVVNFHHYEPLHNNPAGHRDRIIGIWRQIAERYADAGDHVIFELLNEPHGRFTAEPHLWNELAADLLDVVRETNPTRIVIIGPVEYSTIDFLDDLVLPNDNYLISSVHLYEPFNFTHQGASWVELVRPIGVPWSPEGLDFASGFHDRSWDTRISTDGGDLRLAFDRQWAGFAVDLLEDAGLQRMTFRASGEGMLLPGCRNGDFEPLNVDFITTTSRSQEFTVDFSACPSGSTGVGLMNATPGANTLVLSDVEVCSRARGCSEIFTTAESALRGWIQRAAQWSNNTGVPIHLGEFGAFSAGGQVPIADRVAWTSTIVSEANRQNIPYAYWEFQSHFGAYNLNTGRWNQLLPALIQ